MPLVLSSSCLAIPLFARPVNCCAAICVFCTTAPMLPKQRHTQAKPSANQVEGRDNAFATNYYSIAIFYSYLGRRRPVCMFASLRSATLSVLLQPFIYFPHSFTFDSHFVSFFSEHPLRPVTLNQVPPRFPLAPPSSSSSKSIVVSV